MKLRVLVAADIERALDPDALVDALATAFAALSAGRTSTPPRIGVESPGHGVVLLMGAHRHGAAALTAKLVSVFPHVDPADSPTHQALVVVFDAATGTPLMLADGTAITALRTAASSRLATRLLARADARVLAVLGTGVQAAAHVRALVREREFAEVRVAGRRFDAASALAEQLRRETGAPVAATESIAKALRGADVVCAATGATEPVVRRAWLDDGAHVNSVGFSTNGREVDAETVRDALVVVETRAAALAPPPVGCGDLTWPIRDGVIGPDHIHAELGEMVDGSRAGRTEPAQITLYKSVGVGIQDDTAATLALAVATERGLGAVIEL